VGDTRISGATPPPMHAFRGQRVGALHLQDDSKHLCAGNKRAPVEVRNGGGCTRSGRHELQAQVRF
jgi:hypothetical protein